LPALYDQQAAGQEFVTWLVEQRAKLAGR
jgi:hypothetical protein